MNLIKVQVVNGMCVSYEFVHRCQGYYNQHPRTINIKEIEHFTFATESNDDFLKQAQKELKDFLELEKIGITNS